MMGAPNSLNLNCKVRVMKEAPDPSVSEEIADICTNYNKDIYRSPSGIISRPSFTKFIKIIIESLAYKYVRYMVS